MFILRCAALRYTDAAMDAHARREARALLKQGPPFAGTSSFKNKARVKAIGGEHIKWDAASRKWCAQTETAMCELIDEDVWFPLGPDGDALSFAAAAILRDERRAMDKEDHELLTGDAEKPGLVLAHMLKTGHVRNGWLLARLTEEGRSVEALPFVIGSQGLDRWVAIAWARGRGRARVVPSLRRLHLGGAQGGGGAQVFLPVALRD